MIDAAAAVAAFNRHYDKVTIDRYVGIPQSAIKIIVNRRPS